MQGLTLVKRQGPEIAGNKSGMCVGVCVCV